MKYCIVMAWLSVVLSMVTACFIRDIAVTVGFSIMGSVWFSAGLIIGELKKK